MIDLNRFVIHDDYGPVKVVSLNENHCEIELFISPMNQKTIKVNKKEVKYYKLYKQTRVYVELNDGWRMGRIIMDYDNPDGSYDYKIQFPNQEYLEFSEKEIFCRCWLPHDDPTSTFANGGIETQYWHEYRQKFTEMMIKQRSACRGLSTLLSSHIELIPHQIDVARRVLEDPLQRYLLADEVGMGKTIEAGLIIRQFLITHTVGNVFVISPESLIKQWEGELEQKFLISDYPDRVQVKTIDQLVKIDVEDLQLLVVDEAHHFVQKEIPEKLYELSKCSPRLLLLSATPSLGDSQILLNLLRLLDFDNYQNVSVEQLSERVKKSQEIGKFLMGIRSDSLEIVINQRLDKLTEYFPNDKEIEHLGLQTKEALTNKDQDKFIVYINQLRHYIAEVYRIHHRLIRNRRRKAVDWVFRPRGPELIEGELNDISHVSMLWLNDNRFESFYDMFSQCLVDLSSLITKDPKVSSSVFEFVVLMFDRISCGLDSFFEFIKNNKSYIDPDIRNEIINILLEENSENTRSEQIATLIIEKKNNIETNSSKQIRLCIFSSDQNDLINCADELKKHIPGEKILLASDVDPTQKYLSLYLKYRDDIEYFFCSNSEEEGLNLHYFDVIVHLDLPFSPSRLEQRIGRLDRYGRISQVKQWVFLPHLNDTHFNLWGVWFDVLAHGFRIFNESIADVQLSLNLIMEILVQSLINGPESLRDSTSNVREFLMKERLNLEAQDTMDLILQEEVEADSLYNNLDDFDADEIDIANSLHGWLSRCLQFKIEGDMNKYFQYKWDNQKTLLPPIPWALWFHEGLSTKHTYYRKNISFQDLSKKVQLLRIGSSLMQTVEDEYHWDDRGTAFATWRKILNQGDSEWIAFKLCYVIESNVPDGLEGDELSSAEARLDGYLPPWTSVLYVDAEFNPVEDPSYLKMLSIPYQHGERNKLDFNLGNRRDAFIRLIEPVLFEQMCRKIRVLSEEWLRKEDHFKENIKEAKIYGKSDVAQRIKRLQQKKNNIQLENHAEIDREIELNQQILKVLKKPRVRLDAMGLIVLSSRTPEDFLAD